VAVAVGVVVEVGVVVNRIVRVWGVLPPRAQQGGARLPASKQSEAERYEINVFNHAFDAGQPQEVAPPLSADVRPPCAKRAVCAAVGAVRVYAELSLLLTKRGEGRTAFGTERSGRSASERMFAECAEPKRSGVEKPWCRSRATSCEAVRSATTCGAVRV